ncbi:probable Elongator complex protein 1 [Zygosaccharomyces bailii]|nr:probable Elongator complex protein 1 [Zygosaccharomyces bailii]
MLLNSDVLGRVKEERPASKFEIHRLWGIIMRNLVTLNKGSLKPLASLSQDATFDVPFELLDSMFDTLSDSITCVLGNLDMGQVEVQQYTKQGAKNILASFTVDSFGDRLLSFTHFADISQLVFVFEQGDIITVTYDPISYNPQEALVEIAGTIDSGISAAQWSYDEETLAIVTRDGNVVLLSKLYEPIAEHHLELEDLKKSKHVTVGWGKKETQFRGRGARAHEREALASLKASGLKGNELRDPTMPYMVDSGMITLMDNRQVSISWRGDCEYFAVSTIEVVADPDDVAQTIERRAIRIFSRDGCLDGASEPVTGMEHNLSWKPQGSLIASVRRSTHLDDEANLEVIFFERNGLRHGEFETRLDLDETIQDLCWNSNSEVLAVVLQNKIQLWTTKNYHWFLKQEIYDDNIKFVKWHAEKDLTMIYGNSQYINVVDFSYKMTQGPTLEPCDNGTSVVIDGRTVNITPLAIANVPPPAYYRDFDTPENVIDAAVSLSNEIYAVLNKETLVIATVPSLKDMKKGYHPVIASKFSKVDCATEFESFRQIAFINDTIVGILLDTDNFTRVALISIEDVAQPHILKIVDTFDKIVLLRSSFDYNSLVYQTKDGTVMQLDSEGQLEQIARFPQLVRDFRVKRVHNLVGNAIGEWDTDSSEIVAFGLTANGKLYANDVLLASAVTSLEITDSLLLFTTAQHNLQFVHLNSTHFEQLPIVEEGVVDERVRSIERGSILVSVIPSRSAVVLQANRGNLETIYPRIMVLAKVRKDILSKRYGEAFVCCRTHRIHLDILHDYAPELFLENLELFIEQVEKVDHLDFFISCLREEDVAKTVYKETLSAGIAHKFDLEPAPLTEMQQYMKKKMFKPETSKVNKICRAILNVLLSTEEYKKKYKQTIITAYASQNPQNLKDALQLIGAIEDDEERDSLLTYLVFLQDANIVYKIALSLYDINLALAAAQKSQMDPREYLPFLQSLYHNEPLRCRFLVDDHLQNYEKALFHLVKIEKEQNDDSQEIAEEILDYVDNLKLYKHALQLYKYENEKQNRIYHLYAKHLCSKQEYNDAGIIYEMLGDYRSAIDAYTSAKEWRNALSLTIENYPEKLVEVAEQLVSLLSYEHNYSATAEIQVEFLDNIEQGVADYCKAYEFDSACLVASKKGRPELLEKTVDPGLGEGFGTVAELLADCDKQVQSQLKRLRELRSKKETDPYAFYGQEAEETDDVSIAPSETSTKESFFTRYTGKTGGTAKTGASRRTQKNKRREERKRARGKKGTIYEEEYLVKSTGRLIQRLDQTRPDALKLIAGLSRRGMLMQAHQIQRSFADLIQLLKDNLIEIYTLSEKDRERVDDNGEVYYIPEIPIPQIADFPKSKVVDF